MKINKIKAFGLAAVFGLAIPATAFAGDKAGEDGMFKAADSDGDGKLSADEHAAAAKKMFEMMDGNKDGKVTVEEMTAAHEKMGKKPKAGDMSAADKIKVIDKDGDGAITAEEHAEGAKGKFAAMDGDKDNFLTKAEMMAGHHKMMKKDAPKDTK